MPKTTKVEGPATVDAVETALKTYTQPYQQKRLLGVRMAQQGQWTRAQIAKTLGKGRATITRWLRAYLSFGLEAL